MVALVSQSALTPKLLQAPALARALTLTPLRALGILALVLMVHLVVLWWARGELQSSGFATAGKVMYSRLIMPTPPDPAPAAETTQPPAAAKATAKPRASATAKPPSSPRVISIAVPDVQRIDVPVSEPTPEATKPPEAQAQAEPPASTASASVMTQNTDTPNSSIENTSNNVRVITNTNDSINNEARINWPPSSKVSYNLSGYYRGDLHGSGAFEWQRQSDNRYQLSLRVQSLVGIEYRSRGTMDGAALKPERYEEQLPRGVTSVSFNYDTSKVSFSRITDVIDMTPGIQDRASAIMTLVSTLARDARRIDDAQRSGELIKVPVASPTGTDIWDFKVLALETVNADSGPVQAWHLQRLPRKPNGDLGVDLWLSQELRGLPVRIKLTLSSDSYLDLTMTKAEQE